MFSWLRVIGAWASSRPGLVLLGRCTCKSLPAWAVWACPLEWIVMGTLQKTHTKMHA